MWPQRQRRSLDRHRFVLISGKNSSRDGLHAVLVFVAKMGAEILGYFVGKRLDDSIVLCNLGPGIGNTLVHLIGDLDIRIDLHLRLKRTDGLALALHRLQTLLGSLQCMANDVQSRMVDPYISCPLPEDVHQLLDVFLLFRCHFFTHKL